MLLYFYTVSNIYVLQEDLTESNEQYKRSDYGNNKFAHITIPS